MASAYLPSWLHAPSLQSLQSTFYKRVPVGYAVLATVGALSVSYALQDTYHYYFSVKFENRGTLSANPGVFIFSDITRFYRYILGMDGTNTKPIRNAVRKTKIGLYKKKFLKEGELPVKRGPRPDVLIQGFPHRQIAQVLDPALNTAVEGILQKVARAHPGEVTIGPSKVEPNALALWISTSISPDHPDLAASRNFAVYPPEFVHCHASENSLHIVLSPLDCAEAVEKGWAVRFPISGTGIPYMDQPLGRCMVYAPRDMEEVKTIELLVDKSLQYMMSKA